jgi:hypothetical protein
MWGTAGHYSVQGWASKGWMFVNQRKNWVHAGWNQASVVSKPVQVFLRWELLNEGTNWVSCLLLVDSSFMTILCSCVNGYTVYNSRNSVAVGNCDILTEYSQEVWIWSQKICLLDITFVHGYLTVPTLNCDHTEHWELCTQQHWVTSQKTCIFKHYGSQNVEKEWHCIQ